MMAGDTLVTVSLAGSLFFSVSPTEAKGKVLLYLLLTIAPFAVVSPMLGPLIDRSANGRRILVALSAGVRAVLCWLMAEHLNSLWLFPLAFLLLVSSKLYVVTRGALVPEMARTDQFREHGDRVGDAGWPNEKVDEEKGFAGFNAQLTLLGTVVGLVAGSLGAGILKGIGATSVLVVASIVYIAATVASLRLQRPVKTVRDEVTGLTQAERDRNALNPLGDQEVAWGLGAAALMRFSAGFATFLLAFGLRRLSAGLGWYAFALGLSGIGSLGYRSRAFGHAHLGATPWSGPTPCSRSRSLRRDSARCFASLHPVLCRPGACSRGGSACFERRDRPTELRRHHPAKRRAGGTGSHLRALRRTPTAAVGTWRTDPRRHRPRFRRGRPTARGADALGVSGVSDRSAQRACCSSDRMAVIAARPHVRDGGDAACWIHLVCEVCGEMLEGERARSRGGGRYRRGSDSFIKESTCRRRANCARRRERAFAMQ